MSSKAHELADLYGLRPSGGEPPLRRVNIEPSSLCNLNCSICFRHGWTEPAGGRMDMTLYGHLAGQINALPSVGEVFFGGRGEPWSHPDIVGMVGAVCPEKKRKMVSNGTLLDGQMSERLIRAGLDELWISMDGFDEESYERIQTGSRFRQIIQNLDGFNAARAGTGVRLMITFVVTPGNAAQLGKINRFADRFLVDGINISHMVPSTPLARCDAIYDREDIYVGQMYRYAKADPLPEHHCPFVEEGQTFVRWDGDVVPCMQLLHGCTTYLYEERRTINRFSYGNVGRNTLQECGDDPDYRDLRYRVRTFSFPFCTVCWGCEDRRENLCDCFLSEAPTCGACLWATGKIRCP